MSNNCNQGNSFLYNKNNGEWELAVVKIEQYFNKKHAKNRGRKKSIGKPYQIINGNAKKAR